MFLQLQQLLKDVDLTHASAVISYEVAQNFIANGVPTGDKLNQIIQLSAPTIFFVRDRLKSMEDCANVDLGELFTCLSNLHEELPREFKKRFPLHDNVDFTIFHGSIVCEEDLIIFQARVVDTCRTHNRCALSFWFNGQAITGCFEVKVFPYFCLPAKK